MKRLFSRLLNRLRSHLTAWTLAVCLFAAPTFAQWQIETIDGGKGKDVGKFTSLVVDKDSNLHVGYFDSTRQALRYGFRASGSKKWFTMEVDASAGYESLAVDPTGHPHFAYAGADESGLKYAWWDGETWTRQTLDNEKIDFFNSIQMTASGLPRISYYHRLNRVNTGNVYALHLKFAAFDGKTWTIETVDPRSATGKFNSLALDHQGRPHIAYSDVDAGNLLYANWDGSDWQYSTPDTSQASGGWVGIGSSIEMDNRDNPHIAYVDVTHRAIKYATRQGSEPWHTELVDKLTGKADNIDRVSLKLDSRQRPHIAYWDSGLGVLKYATLTDKGWRPQVVDNSANVGLYPSLALDKQDNIYISYYDMGTGTLKLAFEHAEQEKSEQAQNLQAAGKPEFQQK